MTHSSASRIAAATLLGLLLVGSSASTASARPDPGDAGPVTTGTQAQSCPLMRIGTQLIRCDDLTGAGVAAPLFIPELGSLGVAGAR